MKHTPMVKYVLSGIQEVNVVAYDTELQLYLIQIQ